MRKCWRATSASVKTTGSIVQRFRKGEKKEWHLATMQAVIQLNLCQFFSLIEKHGGRGQSHETGVRVK